MMEKKDYQIAIQTNRTYCKSGPDIFFNQTDFVHFLWTYSVF